MTRKEIDRKFDAIVDFSGIEQFIDTPVKYYSSGMYARLGFSVAVHVDPEILLVDEVLSVGDWGFQQKCFEKMREIVRRGTTVVFVSHNLTAITTLCNRCLLLGEGRQLGYGEVGATVTGYNRIMSLSGDSISPGSVTPVHVGMVSLTNASGSDTHVFDTGEEFILVLEVRFMRSMESPVIHLHLYGQEGMQIFATDTQRAGLILEAVDVGATFQVEVTGRINLLGGSYRFACEIMPDPVSPEVARFGSVCSFDVAASAVADGIVELSTKMKLLAHDVKEGGA